MKKIIAAVLGASFSFGALGQDALLCLNPDVVNALLPRGQDIGAPVVVMDRPPQLAGYEAPPELEWIGSMVMGAETVVAFKTDLDAKDAKAALLASLRQAGFETQDSAEPYGFQLTSPPLFTTICRDAEHGSAVVRESAGARFVNLVFRAGLKQSCEEVMSPTEPPSFIPRGFSHIPKLELPPSIRNSMRLGALPTGIGRGSGETFRSSVEVEGVTSMEGLISALGDQIRNQGWTAEAAWSGERSAGSAWTREADGTRLTGKLTVAHIGAGYYDLEFKLVLVN